MSSPPSCLFFPPNNAMFAASFPFASLDLPAPYVRLAHLAFHPAVQDRLAQFPAIAQLECGNLAFGDVTVERIRADPRYFDACRTFITSRDLFTRIATPAPITRPIQPFGAPLPTLRALRRCTP